RELWPDGRRPCGFARHSPCDDRDRGRPSIFGRYPPCETRARKRLVSMVYVQTPSLAHYPVRNLADPIRLAQGHHGREEKRGQRDHAYGRILSGRPNDPEG